ncbi:MAG: DUF4902 domain-containing protein [Dokdonella sp.]
MIQSGKRLVKQCLEYSEDGYIRLTFQQFCALQFSHRLTMNDDDLRDELLEQDVPAFGAGYCEWRDISTPVQISVGWAWFVTADDTPQLLAPGGLSSNVMITSAGGNDLGTGKTDELLRAWLSSLRWQKEMHFCSSPQGESDSRSVH